MYPLIVWMISCLWAQSSKIAIAASEELYRQTFNDPLATSSTGTEIVIVERKAGNNIAEPTCEELRAMWRYSKRQSRAAEKSNELPMYRDPFSYNIWETRPSEYFQPVLAHRGESLHNIKIILQYFGFLFLTLEIGPLSSQSDKPYRPIIMYSESHVDGQPRSRGAGGPPIYGRMVHKAPSGNRLRNGMPDRTKAFEEVTRHYGTINRNPSSSHRRVTSFRVGGGISPPLSQVPQAGRFQHLKELIKTERARELHVSRRLFQIFHVLPFFIPYVFIFIR